MPLNLNTWYRIAIPGVTGNTGIMVTVGDYPEDIPDDHFILELEASPDLAIEKVRMDSTFGGTLALCSNGMFCIEGVEDAADVEADMLSQSVMSAEIPNPWEWMPPAGPGLIGLRLYMTRIPEGLPVDPCDIHQPEEAIAGDDPAKRTVGAYPMDFVFKGEWQDSGNPGKKIKVIWKTDL